MNKIKTSSRPAKSPRAYTNETASVRIPSHDYYDRIVPQQSCMPRTNMQHSDTSARREDRNGATAHMSSDTQTLDVKCCNTTRVPPGKQLSCCQGRQASEHRPLRYAARMQALLIGKSSILLDRSSAVMPCTHNAVIHQRQLTYALLSFSQN